jgi:hypothetical protein
LHCCPSESLRSARILDCGGRAQRRHRFWAAAARYKAAWRFASRRTPKTPGCGFAALRPWRPLREAPRLERPPPPASLALDIIPQPDSVAPVSEPLTVRP